MTSCLLIKKASYVDMLAATNMFYAWHCNSILSDEDSILYGRDITEGARYLDFVSDLFVPYEENEVMMLFSDPEAPINLKLICSKFNIEMLDTGLHAVFIDSDVIESMNTIELDQNNIIRLGYACYYISYYSDGSIPIRGSQISSGSFNTVKLSNRDLNKAKSRLRDMTGWYVGISCGDTNTLLDKLFEGDAPEELREFGKFLYTITF